MKSREENGLWHGYANSGTDREKDHYNIFAKSLDELRELVQEGVAGDLGIEGISFEEIFLTNSAVII